MTDRYRRSSGAGVTYVNPAKMENEFTPKKTMIIMVIVVACFAVLWPRIFYPMFYGSAHNQIKPSAIDKTTGCCYVLSETDVDAIKIMSELCGKIIKERIGDVPLTGRQIINICQDEVFRTCGMDISAVLQEQVRLGQTTKQILDEIRSLNGSLCLKYNFGVQPWRLGVPHIVTLRNVSDSVRQERSPLVRSEMVHPAFRERGSAIPQTNPTRHRIVEGKPGPLPGMRPTLGGPGHVVPPSKQQGSGSMGIIMPIYTIGIVIFFTYTLMKIICKKHPDTDTIYSKMDLDARYPRESLTENISRGSRDASSCKLVVNAMSALLEEVDQEIETRRKSSEVAQDECSGLSNGSVKKDEKPSVKIMGMETTESCEGGKKWQSANSSVLPSTPQPVSEHISPPQEIYLERTLPAQSQILVSDSATETEKNTADDDSPIVLAGKMTLSVISLENEELEIDDILKVKRHETEEAVHENKPIINDAINHIIEEAIESINHSESYDIEIQEVNKAKIEEIPSKIDVFDLKENLPPMSTTEESLLKQELTESALCMNNIQKEKQLEDDVIRMESIEQETSLIETEKLDMEILDERHSPKEAEENLLHEKNIQPIIEPNEEKKKSINETKEGIKDDSLNVECIEQKTFVNVELSEKNEEEEIKDNSPNMENIGQKGGIKELDEKTFVNVEISEKNAEEEIEDNFLGMENIEQKSDSKEENPNDIEIMVNDNILKKEDKEDKLLRVEILAKNIDTKGEESSSEVLDNEEKNVSKETINNTSTNAGNTENKVEESNQETRVIDKEDETTTLKEKENASLPDKNESFKSFESHQLPLDHLDKDDSILSNTTTGGSLKLSLNAKSSSEDSGSTVLSGSNQGSVINVNTRDAERENNEEELEEYEVSEEESEAEYEEEEIEISEEEEIEDNEVERESAEVQMAEIQNENIRAGLMNGTVTHNGAAEDEESEDEEVVEEIIEEYSDDDDEGNWDINSN